MRARSRYTAHRLNGIDAERGLKQTRRARHDPAATKASILDAVEQLMLDEGYAAVSTRRVAAQAGLQPALVQYHFPSSDEMLLAAYRRANEANFVALQQAVASDDPLRALWSLQTDPTHTALATEFMALANHRKPIKAEIASYAERSRRIKAEALARLIDPDVIDPAICTPACAAALMVSIGRTLIVEQAVGISSGHAEVRALVDWLIERIRLRAPVEKKSGRQPRKNTRVQRAKA